LRTGTKYVLLDWDESKTACCSWIDADEAVHWIGMASGA